MENHLMFVPRVFWSANFYDILQWADQMNLQFTSNWHRYYHKDTHTHIALWFDDSSYAMWFKMRWR